MRLRRFALPSILALALSGCVVVQKPDKSYSVGRIPDGHSEIRDPVFGLKWGEMNSTTCAPARCGTLNNWCGNGPGPSGGRDYPNPNGGCGVPSGLDAGCGDHGRPAVALPYQRVEPDSRSTLGAPIQQFHAVGPQQYGPVYPLDSQAYIDGSGPYQLGMVDIMTKGGKGIGGGQMINCESRWVMIYAPPGTEVHQNPPQGTDPGNRYPGYHQDPSSPGYRGGQPYPRYTPY